MNALMQKPWFFIAILAIGLFFKVYNPDQKFLWYNEIVTIGYTCGIKLKPPVEIVIRPLTFYGDQLSLNKQEKNWQSHRRPYPSLVRTANGNDYGKDLLRRHLQSHPH